MKEYPVEFHKLSDKVECIWCNFKGKIRLYKQAGGLIYENKNRYNIFGSCPKCSKPIISYHISEN